MAFFIKGLAEEADYLKQNLLTGEELARAREYVIGRYLMGHQSLAQRVGKPSAVRAVGHANGLNRIAILIPCHRVVRSERTRLL